MGHQSGMREIQPMPNRVREVLDKHAKRLGWKQSDLADKSRISKSQISRYMGESSEPVEVPRDQLNRLAFVIASGYYGSQLPGAPGLETVLFELLDAGGYGQGAVPQKDKRWRELTQSSNPSERVLKAAYVQWIDIWEKSDDKLNPAGEVANLFKNISDLLEFRLSIRPVDTWKALMDGISNRTIDITAVLHYPAREQFLRFSNSISRTGIAMAALVPKCVGQITQDTEMLFTYVDGEIGEALAGKLFRNAHRDKGFDRAEEACDSIVKNPWAQYYGADIPRCFIADEKVCRQIRNDSRFENELNEIRFDDDRLPVAIAVHPEEETLIAVINQALERLIENGDYRPESIDSPDSKGSSN